MDEELKALLEKWKLNQRYIERLEDQEILSVDTLLELSDDNIKAIFNTVGAQCIITKHLAKFKAEKSASLGPASQAGTIEPTHHAAEHEEIASTSNTTGSESIATEQSQENNTTVTLNATTLNSETLTLTADTSRKRKFTGDTDLDLLYHLQHKNVDGKVVLAYYSSTNGFNENIRNLLADIIINEHLKDDYDRKLSFESEQIYASKIVKLFPTESTSVWASSNPGGRQTMEGRRILVSRYYHKRRFLRKGRLLKRAEKGSDTPNLSSDDEDNPLNDDILWLKNSKQPWSKVEDLWKSTSEYRLRKLKAGSTSTAIYMNDYPALRDPTGYLLLEMDFEIEFHSVNNLYAEWQRLSAFIESKLPKAELSKLQNCLTPEGKCIKTICALPYLFQVTTCAKKGKSKQWRPSRQEVGEALLLHVKCNGDIEPTLLNRLSDKYEPFGLSLGPQAIVVGADVDAIDNCYVRVNNILYMVENPKKALDITFKIFHSLDGKYHAEAEREWLFLERAVYGINVGKSGDGRIRSVVADYEKFKLPSE